LQKYHIIPLILTRSKFNKKKLKSILNYPLHLFHAKSNLKIVKKTYKKINKGTVHYLIFSHD
ncbi:MAG: hypothetical protein IJH63_12975, partial [Methanobrevibacter sp.]|nr:hypothetical protein [Methanobrevibacter sp.]